MAGVTIVFEDGSSLLLDATLSQSHERSSDVSDHPLEDGSHVADHVLVKPYKLAVKAVQSYAPIVAPGESPESNRHVSAYQRLAKAHAAAEMVKVQTGLEVYENMAITGLNSPKEAGHGYDVPLDLSFQQLQFATAKTTTVPKSAIGKPAAGTTKPQAKAQVRTTQAQASPKAHKGPVAKAPATPAQASRAQSLLRMLTGAKLF